MRTYEQLTQSEQDRALNIAATNVLRAILEGGIRFNDEANGDDLQARIDAACEKAEKMLTPWFSHEYIMDTCRDDVMRMAQADAEDASYPDASEGVIRLSLARHGAAGRGRKVGDTLTINRRDINKLVRFAVLPQCSNWPQRRSRCPNRAEVWIVAPTGEPVPGGYECRACAERISAEYAEKLGQVWDLVPLVLA